MWQSAFDIREKEVRGWEVTATAHDHRPTSIDQRATTSTENGDGGEFYHNATIPMGGSRPDTIDRDISPPGSTGDRGEGMNRKERKDAEDDDG